MPQKSLLIFLTDHIGGPVLELDADGSNPQMLSTGTRSARPGYAGGTLYWTNVADPASGTTGSVQKIVPGASAQTVTQTDHAAFGVAVGPGAVFFTVGGETDGALWAAPR